MNGCLPGATICDVGVAPLMSPGCSSHFVVKNSLVRIVKVLFTSNLNSTCENLSG